MQQRFPFFLQKFSLYFNKSYRQRKAFVPNGAVLSGIKVFCPERGKKSAIQDAFGGFGTDFTQREKAVVVLLRFTLTFTE